jgi:hypothetical protein
VLRQRWLQTLLRADVTTVGQLRALSDEQLSEIPNIGPKAIADIAAALATPGLTPDDPLHAIASPTTSGRDRQILAMRQSGATLAAIARHVQISPQRVRQILEQLR